jgi:hypothetical protein
MSVLDRLTEISNYTKNIMFLDRDTTLENVHPMFKQVCESPSDTDSMHRCDELQRILNRCCEQTDREHVFPMEKTIHMDLYPLEHNMYVKPITDLATDILHSEPTLNRQDIENSLTFSFLDSCCRQKFTSDLFKIHKIDR